MSLYAGVLEAQRTKECEAELGAPAVRRCKSPLCDRPLIARNRSGWCYRCKRCRWAAREARLRRKAEGRCIHNCSNMAAPGRTSCVDCLEDFKKVHQKRKARPERREAMRRSRRAYVERMVRLGRCPQCGKDKKAAKTYLCGRCKQRAVVLDRAYRQRRRVAADRARVRELMAAVAA